MNYTKEKTVVKTKKAIPTVPKKEIAPKANNAQYLKVENASVKEFLSLKEISGYNNDELAGLVGITHRTIRNKNSSNELFDIAQTERLRKLYLLFTEGNEIFGDKNQFSEWLQKPSYGLDYTIPSALLKQPGGLDKVLTEINSIKFGDTV